jgi:hypothetical protein
MRKGYSVINPAGSWLLDAIEPMSFEEWILMDYGLINVSDYVFRIPGDSEGCDLEQDYAVRHNKDVFTDLGEFYDSTEREVDDG